VKNSAEIVFVRLYQDEIEKDSLEELLSDISLCDKEQTRYQDEKNMLDEAIRAAKKEEVALHLAYDLTNEKIAGLVSLCLYTGSDDDPLENFILVHLIIVSYEYRGDTNISVDIGTGELIQTTLLNAILQYVYHASQDVYNLVGLNKIMLFPVCDKVAEKYKSFGFAAVDDTRDVLVMKIEDNEELCELAKNK
jgi:hypothetical protein